MKIGMCMFLWTTDVTREHEPVLRQLKQTGFDGVEIPLFDRQPEDYRRLGKMLDEIGLQRTAVSALGDLDTNPISENAGERRAGIDRIRWAIECSNALGAEILCGPLHSVLGHFSGTSPSQAEIDRSIDAQQRVAELASANGVTICLEALNRFECYLFNTMDQLCTHVRQVAHPNIQAMYDTFHANIEESHPVDAFVRNAGEIRHVHISENTRGTPGNGNIDWPAFFSAIRQSEYDGWLTIEAFGRSLPDLAAATKIWRDLSDSPEEVFEQGYRLIRESLTSR